jgi:hypothetical protein
MVHGDLNSCNLFKLLHQPGQTSEVIAGLHRLAEDLSR